MALPLEWPDDVWLQALICAGFVALTLMLVRIDLFRSAVLSIGGAALEGSRRVAGQVIWLFDKVMPLNGRSGELPRLNFAAWLVFNTAIVGAWIATGEIPAAAPYAVPAAATAAAFATLNLLLLGASYWAVRETIDVTNGEMTREQARFAETSPARNVIFVIGTGAVLVLQIAVVMDWAQHAEAVTLVETDGTIGSRYLNFLLATVDALPLAAFYVAPLAHHAGFSGGLFGVALDRGLNGLGSILIVSTAIGLFQQRLAFRRMVDKLVDSPAFDSTLLARLMKAPDAVKGYISQAFRSGGGDQRRLKLAQLAIMRDTFSFPRTFAADYKHYGPELREAGTRLVAEFIESRRPALREGSLQSLFDVCDWGVHKGFSEPDEQRRMARVVVPALEALFDLNAEAGKARILSIMGKRILSATLAGGADAGLRVRAARLMLRTESCEPIPRLLRAMPQFDEITAREFLRAIVNLVATAPLPPSQREARALLEDIAQAATRTESRLPSAANQLANIRRQVRRRQRAGGTGQSPAGGTEVAVDATAAEQPQPVA